MKKSLKIFLGLMTISYLIIFAMQVHDAQDRADRYACMTGLKCPDKMPAHWDEN